MMKIWLAVNNDTDEVDWGTLDYVLEERPEYDGGDDKTFNLIDGWEWKPYKIEPWVEEE